MINYKMLRKIFIFIVGITILLVGLALLVLPGPGVLIIFLGVAILATEFVWAKILMKKIKHIHKKKKRQILSKFKL